MIGLQREQDFRDDISVVSRDGVSFNFNTAYLVAMLPALVPIIECCKEDTTNLIFDYNTETLESLFDLLHLGEGCINGNYHLSDLKNLFPFIFFRLKNKYCARNFDLEKDLMSKSRGDRLCLGPSQLTIKGERRSVRAGSRH